MNKLLITVGIAALVLVFAGACGRSKAAGAEVRTRYTVSFEAEPAPSAQTLEECVAVYKARMGKVASQVDFAVQADARTLTAELALADLVEAYPPPDKSLNAETFANDFMRKFLQKPNEFALLAVVTDEELAAQNTHREIERERLDAWCGSHPLAELSEYDFVPRDRNGPLPGMIWRPYILPLEGIVVGPAREPLLLALPAQPKSRFARTDVRSWSPTTDELYGYPALGLELANQGSTDSAGWATQLVDHPIAILVDEEIFELATLKSRGPGSRTIQRGGHPFTTDEVRVLQALVSAPALPLRPKAVMHAAVR